MLRSRQQTGTECYGTPVDDRNTTSGSTGSEYSTSRVTGSTFLPSRGFHIVHLSSDVSICGFRQTGSGCLSTGSSFATVIPRGDLRQSSLMHLSSSSCTVPHGPWLAFRQVQRLVKTVAENCRAVHPTDVASVTGFKASVA